MALMRSNITSQYGDSVTGHGESSYGVASTHFYKYSDKPQRRSLIDRFNALIGRLSMKRTRLHTRLATMDDVEQIYELHLRAVREICSHDYTPGQIGAWTERNTAETYRKAIRSGKPLYVAELQKRIVGFAARNANEIIGLYVHPDFLGRKIAEMLLRRMEQDAKKDGTTEVMVQSTLTAVKFYEHAGFKNLGPEEKTTASGVTLPVMRMLKKLI